jgi:ABC-type lipoprotein export system ATPase subunit
MLELKNIRKTFYIKNGEVNALQEVSFTLSSGEFLVIRGPSGCGKTTLLLVAGCLLKPTGGQVILNDLDPYNLHMDQVNRLRSETIGFVFQQYHLIPYLSVRDNVLSPSLASKDPVNPDRVDELIRHFGLQERASHLPFQLSTGEKQRTALARALFNKPEIILADEPTGNLDEENAAIIYSYLKQYTSEGGSTLLVSHDSMVCDYATRVLHMSNGRIYP